MEHPIKIMGPFDFSHSKITKIQTIVVFKLYTVIFKSLNGLSCEPFNDYFQIMSHQQNTRNNDYCLRLPKVKLEVARKGFYFQGAMAFNKLPLHVRQINSIVHFKSALKKMNSF